MGSPGFDVGEIVMLIPREDDSPANLGPFQVLRRRYIENPQSENYQPGVSPQWGYKLDVSGAGWNLDTYAWTLEYVMRKMPSEEDDVTEEEFQEFIKKIGLDSLINERLTDKV